MVLISHHFFRLTHPKPFVCCCFLFLFCFLFGLFVFHFGWSCSISWVLLTAVLVAFTTTDDIEGSILFLFYDNLLWPTNFAYYRALWKKILNWFVFKYSYLSLIFDFIFGFGVVRPSKNTNVSCRELWKKKTERGHFYFLFFIEKQL